MIIDHSLLRAGQIKSLKYPGEIPPVRLSSSLSNQSIAVSNVQSIPLPNCLLQNNQTFSTQDSDILEYLDFLGDEILEEFDFLLNSMVLESTMCDIEISAMDLTIGFGSESLEPCQIRFFIFYFMVSLHFN